MFTLIIIYSYIYIIYVYTANEIKIMQSKFVQNSKINNNNNNLIMHCQKHTYT